MYKISFCIVAMNRLHHIKQTLPINLQSNSDYERLEIILLDYNSSDALEKYIREIFFNEIQSGLLIYFRSESSKYFKRSHSRNLAFKLASGDIICNIDADNFTGVGFASYINIVFNTHKNMFLSTVKAQVNGGGKDCLGRICVLKKDFLKVSGYDEKMISYGFEDYDLIQRLGLAGLENRSITNNFLRSITHEDNERIRNELPLNEIFALYVNYIDSSHSELFLIFKDSKAKIATVRNNRTFQSHSILNRLLASFEFSILESDWRSGAVKITKDMLCLYFTEGCARMFTVIEVGNLKEDCSNSVFYKIADKRVIEEILLFYSEICNRLIMEDNLLRRKIKVNVEAFGCDYVYKNFNKKVKILIQ